MTTSRTQQIEQLQQEWKSERWAGIQRPYSADDVITLRGSLNPESTLAQHGAAKLWALLHGSAQRLRELSRCADRRTGVAAGESGH